MSETNVKERSAFIENSGKPAQQMDPMVNSPTDGDSELEPRIGYRTWLVFGAIVLCQYGTIFASLFFAFWYSAIIQSFTQGASKALWIPNAGLVFGTGTTPIFGLWSDFGGPTQKWISVIGTFIGAIGLIVCGSAHNVDIVILGGTIYGGWIITYGAESAIIAEIFPHRMRGAAQGYIYAAQALGGLTALTGGAAMIRDNVGGAGGWRWGFYLCAILGFVGSIVLALAYNPIHPDRDSHIPYLKRMAKLDWIGAALLCLGIVPLMIGLTWATTVYPWKSAASIVPVVGGGIFLILFGLHQRFIRKDGAMNHQLFQNRNFGLVLICVAIEGLIYVTLLVFLGQQISILIDARPVQYGLYFAILQVSAAAGAIFWGFLSQKFRMVKPFIIAGFIGFLGATIGFSQIKADSHASAIAYGCCVLTGISLGAPLALLLATAQLAVKPELTGLSSYLTIGCRSFGGSIGVAIAFSIFTSKITDKLPADIVAYALQAGVSPQLLMPVVGAVAQANGAPVSIPGVSEAQIAAAQLGRLVAFADSFSYIYYEMIPWIVLAIFTIIFLRPVTQEMNWKIDDSVETDAQLGLAKAEGDTEAQHAEKVNEI